jgi:peptidoglycan/xylan/chitin deacetylase (PgdA/CDA1 family)
MLRSPKWMRLLAPSFVEWEQPTAITEPAVYLTFDDGPHPKASVYALDTLNHYEAKASFFCVGNNVARYPDIFARIQSEGHAIGNHTFDHLNGWKTGTSQYLNNVQKAASLIDSKLFRPPYGRLRFAQAKLLHQQGFRIVMWSLLSGDFDRNLSPLRCLENIIFHLQPGDILVLHDSEKAWERMEYVLPRVLEFCKKKRWALKTL